MTSKYFDLQGHRGARGLKPENTLPAIEAALDVGVSSIETDVHLTHDGMPVFCHDPVFNPTVFHRQVGGDSPEPAQYPPVRSLTLAQLRTYRAHGNPDPRRFLRQDAVVTPVAALFARQQGIDPFTIPTVADLAGFLRAYAGLLGEQARKTAWQRQRAERVRLDLELKRVPYHPEWIGDDFDGTNPGLLERRLVEELTAAGLVERTAVRSFDHRAVRAIRTLEPRLAGAVLVADTVPVAPEELARAATASAYCPALEFVDQVMVRRLHEHGVRVLPWTVNALEDWERLLAWQVDGITTDYPDELARLLQARGINF